MTVRRMACALLLALCAGAGGVAKADPASIALEASSLLARAEAMMRDARSAPQNEAAMAQAIRAYETGLVAANAGLSALSAERGAAAERLSGHVRLVADIQTALRQIEAIPPVLRVEQEGGSLAAARAALLLAHLHPQLVERAAGVQAQLDELATLEALQIAFSDDIRAASADVAAARGALGSGASDPKETGAMADALGRTARDLASLARSLDSGRTGGEAASSEAEGAWDWPVAGPLRRAFNEADAAGIARPGMVLAAVDGALVTAPLGATVRFTGPFLNHGQVIILAPDAERLVVLSGMARVFVSPGERIRQGAAIGLMPGGDSGDEDFLIAFEAGDGAFLNQSLYVEFRRSGIAEDPVPFFETEIGNER